MKLDTPQRDLTQVGRFRDRVNSCSGHCGRRAGDSGGSVVREGVPVGDCNDKPGSLTVTARISRSLQTPKSPALSTLG